MELMLTGDAIDGFLHVNPRLPRHAALAMLFNPTLQPLSAPITLPLYYSGLEYEALVSIGGGPAQRMPLARDYSLTVNVSVPAESTTWVLLERECVRPL